MAPVKTYILDQSDGNLTIAKDKPMLIYLKTPSENSRAGFKINNDRKVFITFIPCDDNIIISKVHNNNGDLIISDSNINLVYCDYVWTISD